MAGVNRQLSGYAITALACVGVWVIWLLVSLFSSSGVWRITAGDIILLLAMVISIPVLLFCCVMFLRRKAQGLSVFTVERPVEAEIQRVPSAVPIDPLDPNYLLKNPPADAQVTQHQCRRVVLLADGSAIGELLGGRARRFASLDDFRSFIGA